jgi:hypothetical protein
MATLDNDGANAFEQWTCGYRSCLAVIIYAVGEQRSYCSPLYFRL